MNLSKQLFASVLVMLAVGALSACGGSENKGTNDDSAADSSSLDGGNSNNSSDVVTKTIDATAGGRGVAADDPANKYTYFNLATGEVVELTDVEAEFSTNWDIAFKRTNTKLNGGVSGAGSVSGAIADAQEDYYNAEGEPNDSVFLNATSDLELASLEAITNVSGLDFATDRYVPAIIGGYGEKSMWSYDRTTHTVSVVSDQWWLVKSSSGDSYAKLHATDLTKTDSSRDITLEYFFQASGESAFSTTPSTHTFNIPLDGGGICYDFDAAVEDDCTSADWDIKVEYANRTYNIWTNGGVFGDGDGAATGPVEGSKVSDYVSGTLTSSDSNYSAHYSSDGIGGVFIDNGWYEYSLQGEHKLWPNYRVYAIDTGSAQYALQILSFYNKAGTSGWITLRYKEM